jgi:hypothetical protein
MLCKIGIAGHRADPHTFVWELLDLSEWQPIDIDQPVRRFHAHFHQVDQIRPTTQKFILGLTRNGCDGLIRIRCA